MVAMLTKRKDLSKKLKEYVRILKLAKRPKKEEFSRTSKIAGAGMLLIGSIGFFIYLLMYVLPSRL